MRQSGAPGGDLLLLADAAATPVVRVAGRSEPSAERPGTVFLPAAGALGLLWPGPALQSAPSVGSVRRCSIASCARHARLPDGRPKRPDQVDEGWGRCRGSVLIMARPSTGRRGSPPGRACPVRCRPGGVSRPRARPGTRSWTSRRSGSPALPYRRGRLRSGRGGRTADATRGPGRTAGKGRHARREQRVGGRYRSWAAPGRPHRDGLARRAGAAVAGTPARRPIRRAIGA